MNTNEELSSFSEYTSSSLSVRLMSGGSQGHRRMWSFFPRLYCRALSECFNLI